MQEILNVFQALYIFLKEKKPDLSFLTLKINWMVTQVGMSVTSDSSFLYRSVFLQEP